MASMHQIRKSECCAESEKQTLRGEMNLMTRIRMTISGTEKFHCAQVYSPRLVPFRGVLIFAI